MNFLWAIAILVVSYVVQALTTSRPKGADDAKPATLQDFQFPQWSEGTPQAVVFGDAWVSDWMVVAATNLRNEPIRAKTSSSGGIKK